MSVRIVPWSAGALLAFSHACASAPRASNTTTTTAGGTVTARGGMVVSSSAIAIDDSLGAYSPTFHLRS